MSTQTYALSRTHVYLETPAGGSRTQSSQAVARRATLTAQWKPQPLTHPRACACSETGRYWYVRVYGALQRVGCFLPTGVSATLGLGERDRRCQVWSSTPNTYPCCLRLLTRGTTASVASQPSPARGVCTSAPSWEVTVQALWTATVCMGG